MLTKVLEPEDTNSLKSQICKIAEHMANGEGDKSREMAVDIAKGICGKRPFHLMGIHMEAEVRILDGALESPNKSPAFIPLSTSAEVSSARYFNCEGKKWHPCNDCEINKERDYAYFFPPNEAKGPLFPGIAGRPANFVRLLRVCAVEQMTRPVGGDGGFGLVYLNQSMQFLIATSEDQSPCKLSDICDGVISACFGVRDFKRMQKGREDGLNTFDVPLQETLYSDLKKCTGGCFCILSSPLEFKKLSSDDLSKKYSWGKKSQKITLKESLGVVNQDLRDLCHYQLTDGLLHVGNGQNSTCRKMIVSTEEALCVGGVLATMLHSITDNDVLPTQRFNVFPFGRTPREWQRQKEGPCITVDLLPTKDLQLAPNDVAGPFVMEVRRSFDEVWGEYFLDGERVEVLKQEIVISYSKSHVIHAVADGICDPSFPFGWPAVVSYRESFEEIGNPFSAVRMGVLGCIFGLDPPEEGDVLPLLKMSKQGNRGFGINIAYVYYLFFAILDKIRNYKVPADGGSGGSSDVREIPRGDFELCNDISSESILDRLHQRGSFYAKVQTVSDDFHRAVVRKICMYIGWICSSCGTAKPDAYVEKSFSVKNLHDMLASLRNGYRKDVDALFTKHEVSEAVTTMKRAADLLNDYVSDVKDLTFQNFEDAADGARSIWMGLEDCPGLCC